jgi:hypothetical protein
MLLEKKESQSIAEASDSSGSGGGALYDELKEVEIAHFRPPREEEASSSPFYFANQKKTSSQRKPTLPPWLSHRDDPAATPTKLRRLRNDLSSHLSSKQIATVLNSIRDASGNDPQKAGGASDFCSLLVNSLEMSDVSALVAAAFHYCSLVGVREREVRGEETVGGDPDATIKYLCALAGSGIEAYSPHSMKIALDAARLKAAEALAQTVVRPTAGGIVGDASNLRSLLLSVNGVGDWRALAIRSAACLYRLDGLKRWREGEGFDGRRTKEEARAGYEALHIFAPLGE